MATETVQDIYAKIPLTADLAEKWDRFIYDRGYSRGPFLRSFIEAITDPVRGPKIERIIQNLETPEAQA
jgi:hypothetical protein